MGSLLLPLGKAVEQPRGSEGAVEYDPVAVGREGYVPASPVRREDFLVERGGPLALCAGVHSRQRYLEAPRIASLHALETVIFTTVLLPAPMDPATTTLGLVTIPAR